MRKLTILLAILALAMASAAFAQATPEGATVTAGVPETKVVGTAGSANAQGGNITAIDLVAQSQTDAWQGFYGNVSGNITLQDAGGSDLFTWILASLQGEIFASTDSAVDWSAITSVNDCTIDEGITGTGNDRVNLTYTNGTISAGGVTVAGVSLTDACRLNTYVSSAPQSATFEAFILNTTTANVVYGTRINASSTSYDGGTTDYQIIVPANQTLLTYFFYVEFD